MPGVGRISRPRCQAYPETESAEPDLYEARRNPVTQFPPNMRTRYLRHSTTPRVCEAPSERVSTP